MEFRKDKDIGETIGKIKELLIQAGIEVHVVFKANPKPLVYSCRIELRDLPGIGTNGKGTSENAALASAYSELMERLQNRILIESLFCGFSNKVKKESPISSWDKLKKMELFLCSPSMENNISKDEIEDLSYEDNIEFVNITTSETVHLNKELLDYFLGSNGMCAGNSYEEAVSQGLCEIMERYVLKELYLGILSDSDVCVIPQRYYEHYNVYALIKELEDSGFECKVLNCSLRGRFPVVGFVIINHKTLKANFSLGCDFDLEIALQRCVTEIFQGKRNMLEMRYSMHSVFDLASHEKNIIIMHLETGREQCLWPY